MKIQYQALSIKISGKKYPELAWMFTYWSVFIQKAWSTRNLPIISKSWSLLLTEKKTGLSNALNRKSSAQVIPYVPTIFLQFSYLYTGLLNLSSAVSWTQNEYTMCQNACAGITRSKHCNTGWNPTLHDITEHRRWFWSMLSKRNKRTKDSGSTELTGNIAAPWK